MSFLTRLVLAIWLAMPVAASADVFDEIQQREEIVIGVSIFAPWTYLNRAGELGGHEIDLGNGIAADLGVSARFEIYNFEEIFDALENDEIDMIAAGVAMTAERARRFHFSIPYMSTGVTVATANAAFENGVTMADLNVPEITVAVVEDTLAARIAESRLDGATIAHFATVSGAEGSVLTGRAQAYVASVPEARVFALRNAARVSLPLDEPLVAGVAGFVVREDEDRLLHFLNSWIHMRRADGLLDDRHRYYFDTLDWAVDIVQQ